VLTVAQLEARFAKTGRLGRGARRSAGFSRERAVYAGRLLAASIVSVAHTYTPVSSAQAEQVAPTVASEATTSTTTVTQQAHDTIGCTSHSPMSSRRLPALPSVSYAFNPQGAGPRIIEVECSLTRHWTCPNCRQMYFGAEQDLPERCGYCHDMTTWLPEVSPSVRQALLEICGHVDEVLAYAIDVLEGDLHTLDLEGCPVIIRPKRE
jgi:hypothetical protein